MNTTINETVNLIQQHTFVADVLANLLRLRLGRNNLLEAHWSDQVPKSGELCCSNSRYRFHGCGCALANESYRIDIEFGPEGRTDGFDAFRLFKFEKENSTGGVSSVESIERDIQSLEQLGAIEKLPEFSPNLYFPTPRFTEIADRLSSSATSSST